MRTMEEISRMLGHAPRVATHIRADQLKAGQDYRLTEGGDWASIKNVFVNGNHVVLTIYATGATRSIPSNEIVEARL